MNNTQETADELLDFVKKGKEVYDVFTAKFSESYIICGKSMSEWYEEFTIDIPEDLNIQSCKVIDGKILELYQKAAFFKAAATAAVKVIEQGTEDKYGDKLTELIEEYKSKDWRLPAAPTLKTLVNYKMSTSIATVLAAKVAEEFWVDICNGLKGTIKTIENVTFNNNIDQKLNNHSY